MAPPPLLLLHHHHHLLLHLLLLLSFLSLHPSTINAAATKHATTPRYNSGVTTQPSSLVLSSCAHARYPKLCVNTLSSSSASTPADLTRDAVSASHSSASNATSFLILLRPSGKPRERGAVRDCAEQLADSADELAQTESELARLRPETFRWQLENAKTWVSAALTDSDTCVDGLRGLVGPTSNTVMRKVSKVSRVTSNALYLINRLAASRGMGH